MGKSLGSIIREDYQGGSGWGPSQLCAWRA